jgi:hypothetical protein
MHRGEPVKSPQAVALGDQVHAEITDRANQAVAEMAKSAGIELNDAQMMLAEIGVQAGLNAALHLVASRGWLVVPLPGE